MLEINFILKWAHTTENSVCLSDMENKRLRSVIVRVGTRCHLRLVSLVI